MTDCALCGRMPWFWRAWWHVQIPGPTPIVAQAQRMTRGQAMYLLSTPSGHFKIGIARDPGSRRRELQTGNPEPIKLEGATIATDWGVDPRSLEMEIHRLLAPYRTSGAWFKAPQAVINRAWQEAWCSIRHPALYQRWQRFSLHVRSMREYRAKE